MREQLPQTVQNRAHDLMERNNLDSLTETEQMELQRLVERADGVMLRKAEAMSILRQRGFDVTQKDFLIDNG
jgi:hypothetical protein